MCSTVCHFTRSCGRGSAKASGRVPLSSSSNNEKYSVSPATLFFWLRRALFVASALAAFWLRGALYVKGPNHDCVDGLLPGPFAA